jgi:hypothetical protein
MLLDETKHFPWFFARSQVEQDNIPYFSHTLVDRDGKVTSHFFDFFHKINLRFCEAVDYKLKRVIRSCVNLTLPFVGKPTLHIDHYEPHFQILMYLNDSTGSTDIYKDNNIVKSIQPKKGRVIMFDKHYHLGNSPTEPNQIRAICITTFNVE